MLDVVLIKIGKWPSVIKVLSNIRFMFIYEQYHISRSSWTFLENVLFKSMPHLNLLLWSAFTNMEYLIYLKRIFFNYTLWFHNTETSFSNVTVRQTVRDTRHYFPKLKACFLWNISWIFSSFLFYSDDSHYIPFPSGLTPAGWTWRVLVTGPETPGDRTALDPVSSTSR